MRITTERLILRPWKHGDRHEAESLFRYASDPEIGIRCGWMPHRNVEESLNTLDNVFTGDENYAITLRNGDDDRPIGAIELKKTGPDDHVGEFVREAIDRHNLFAGVDENETKRALAHYDGDRVLGYWIGRPFWGQGMMSEALWAMIRHAFANLGCNAVWGGHYVENPASGKVMEHCGMQAVCRKDGDYFPLIDQRHDAMVRVITKEEWERNNEKPATRYGR
ncbi:GNAT family N-acetyltransferase [Bifidobacterium sp. ESL0798]|uniref:GNAT family N-acetyltransferase n=1 Tax=Bifidobacterium sp. ESL0798 TaxID=2983235 RepID=UPI0023F9AD8F|nr:GNAT family N-acetyltransferase [Bifidobacterium sp. ESL0798]WEV74374.1 GNAT family N-acetyltransferase [Bifidobacterium sp. ESL0798]